MQSLYKERASTRQTGGRRNGKIKNLNFNFLGNTFFMKHLKIDLQILEIKLRIAKLNQFYIPVYDYTRSPGSALKLRVIVSYIVAIVTK